MKHEAEAIDQIVKEISMKLHSIHLVNDENLIGLDRPMQELESSLGISLNDEVRMIGIKGMGGIGKTTLARAIFDKVSSHFEGKRKGSFKKERLGVIARTSPFKKHMRVESVYEGERIMRMRLPYKKVLLVLDDVDDTKQLEVLAGDWFKDGSRIIITTRDEKVLLAHGVNADWIHDVSLVLDEEGLSLFCRYAFKRYISDEGYEKLSLEVVCYAAGLPLTIKVLGSHLCGENKDVWTDALKRLETIPSRETLEILEISYNYLEDDHKEMFLDVLKKLRFLDLTGSKLRTLDLRMTPNLESLDLERCRDLTEIHAPTRCLERLVFLPKDIGQLECLEKLVFTKCASLGDIPNNVYNMKCLRYFPLPFCSKVLKLPEELGNLKLLKYFGGEDTRIHTFRDNEELQKGEQIDQLFKAIEESRLFIIVFSKNYATSSWCLKEVTKIMECQDENQQIAYPLFYDVAPSDIRYQIELVGEAIAKHESDEQIKKWGKALESAANLVGWDLKNIANGHEAEAIKTIVKEISLKLRSIHLSSGENLIGMDRRMQDVESFLGISLNDKARIIGIKGMGGIGKTSLAKAIFKKVSSHFEASVFVEDVREVSKQKGLRSLQKQVLSRVLNDEHMHVESVYEGERVMKMRLPYKKVLLVLDDVDDAKQLKALAGDWFKDGSRIIVTTRDDKLLLSHGVNAKWIYNVSFLSDEEAMSLFSRYAFKKHMPDEGYEKISSQVVRYADGLPLTIKVLGSNLHGENEFVWRDALKILATIPSAKTLEVLEISYNSLEDDHKEMFLDVACFFKGSSEEYVTRMLDCCGFRAGYGLKSLVQKSLITISNGRLGMQKSLITISNIADSGSVKKLNIYSMMRRTKGSTCIGLQLYLEELSPEIIIKSLGNFNKLRYLILFGNDDDCFPTDWKFNQEKHWKGYPGLSLPQTFRANNLAGLHLTHSKIMQLWESGERKVLKKLKVLDLKDSKLRTLDFGMTPNLEKLDLQRCHDLTEIHATGGCLERIVYVNLRSCPWSVSFSLSKQMESLGLFRIANLLVSVKCLDELPRDSSNNLPMLRFEFNYYKEKPSSKGIVSKGVFLDLQPRTKLESVSQSICGLQSLKDLTIDGCIPELPDDMDQLKCLEQLTLWSTHIKCLPDSVCMLKYLNSLKLFDCQHLEELPENLGWLENLEKLSLSSISIKRLPDSICMLINLKSLLIRSCELLEKLPEDIRQLKCLEKLVLKNCACLGDIPNSICNMKCLRYFYLPSCSEVEKLPEEFGNLKLLEELDIANIGINLLPNSISSLKGLHIVGSTSLLQACTFATEIKIQENRSLCCIRELVWRDVLKRLETIPSQETLEVLEISYNNLEDDHKEMFLDVACFLKGFPEDDAIRALDSCGFHATYGLRILQQKSLITISNDGRLGMHDRVQELGEIIVRRAYPREPNKRSRLYIEEEIEELFSYDAGTEASTCIGLYLEPKELTPEIIIKSLVNLKKLRYLSLHGKLDDYFPTNWKFDQEKQYFPNSLKCLYWHRYPGLSLPRTFRANNLVGLELPRSKIMQLWESGERKVLKKLKFLNIFFSKLRTLNLGMTPNLERLNIEGCQDLTEIHAHAECLQKLVYVNLRGCSWSISFSLSKKLESLVLISLPKLHVFVRCLEEFPRETTNNQLMLRFSFEYSEEQPSSTRFVTRGVFLDLQLRKKLESVSRSICSLQHLRHLTLDGCIPELPDDLDQLKCLQQLALFSTHIKCLPDSVCMLKHLNSFRLKDCLYLEELPKNLGWLENLKELRLVSTSIRCLPYSICMLKRLRSLEVRYCQVLEKIPEDLGRLVCLEELRLVSTSIRCLPDSICMLIHLKYLQLESCGLLEKLPEDIGKLECLEKLSLTKCESLEDIPNNICKMKCLRYFYLRHCSQVQKLADEFGNLKLLEQLDIAFTGISHLPHSISSLKGLRIFGSMLLLQSYAFATKIKISKDGTFGYIQGMNDTPKSILKE
ncbi:hypothetical protein LXL04_010616 [Taraxacum kok-saghyz]